MNDYYEFEDIGVERDTLGVRKGFAGTAIIDGWNGNGFSTPSATSIELSPTDVFGVIEALVTVSGIDALDLIARLTGASFEVAA